MPWWLIPGFIGGALLVVTLAFLMSGLFAPDTCQMPSCRLAATNIVSAQTFGGRFCRAHAESLCQSDPDAVLRDLTGAPRRP